MSGADQAAAAVVAAWTRLVEARGRGWVARREGAVAAVTGLAAPPLNVVFALDATGDAAAIAGLLDDIGAAGLPCSLQLRPGAGRAQAALPPARGMAWSEDLPLMAWEGAAAPMRAEPEAALVLRQLRPDEVTLHARVAAAGFGAPAETFLQLMTPNVLSIPGLRCYVGEVDGDAVTTGFGVTTGDAVTIFNVATVPHCRGHGFGSAITARIVADAVAAGASSALLQASDAGFSVYERLGFRTVERWPCWTSST